MCCFADQIELNKKYMSKDEAPEIKKWIRIAKKHETFSLFPKKEIPKDNNDKTEKYKIYFSKKPGIKNKIEIKSIAISECPIIYIHHIKKVLQSLKKKVIFKKHFTNKHNFYII
jgi:hypothetical protein